MATEHTSMFSTTTNTKLPPAVRGLTPALAAEADAAVEDGLERIGPNTPEVVDAVTAIKRYLNRKGFTVRTVYDGDTVHWQAVPKRERPPMSDEHKAKLRKALATSRATKAKAKATAA